ncbi:MAG: translation initiation factor IF-2 [Candidatus Omnitrophica bacterium]|nr:translation initiation factor IF-2 [Candidatus Omnitrophota bacterium]
MKTKSKAKPKEKPVKKAKSKSAVVARPASKTKIKVASKAKAVKIIAKKSTHEVKPVSPKPVLAQKAMHEEKPVIHKPIHEVKPIAPKPVHEVKTVHEVKPAAPKPAHEVKPAPVVAQPKPVAPVKEPVVAAVVMPVAKVLNDLELKLLDEAIVALICEKYGFKIKYAPNEEEIILSEHKEEDAAQDLKPRSPIVTFMGHVDHGKTSLLDAIRKTKVADKEHGGITQHIGAYRVTLSGGVITFLDTPGHEAFTAMRARGASVTDIVVLVVAADDGVMPQTIEAVDHAKAAGVSIMVAINKVDKPQADLDKVKKQLAKIDLNPEDWGGKTIMVPVSAKTGQGIDNLLGMILLESQMLELKANAKRLARGIVIEAKISQGRGPVATLLVQNGTLHLNENIIVGKHYGKIRAMFNDRGQSVTSAGPAFPVEVLGLSSVPEAGDQFFVIADEKKAKELAQKRQEAEKQIELKSAKKVSLEELYTQIKAGVIKELKLVIKADVQGSLEAIKDVLGKIDTTEEIKMMIIHEGMGNINSSDVVLAAASNALILGFNISIDDRAKGMIEKEGVDVRNYNIIYELANEVKAALEGMLEPKIKKVFLGKAEIRKVFNLSRSGIIAGSFVVKGRLTRNCLANLVRNGEVVFEGKVSSLKRFKDDVRDVAEGFECGLALGGFTDYKEGDIVEAYELEKIARKL